MKKTPHKHCIRVLQRNIYPYLFIHPSIHLRDLIQEIDSHDYGDWKISWPTVCKLDTQESWWWVPVWAWKTDNQECQGSKSQSEGRRKSKSQLISQAESILAFPTFYFTQDLNALDDAHLHWGEQFALFGLPIQMLISSKNSLSDTTRSDV